MNFLRKYINTVEKFNNKLGNWVSWLSSLLVVLVCLDVFSRYLLRESSVAVQELEWHLFAVLFLMGAAYTLLHEKHVRVDVFYSRFSRRNKAIINIIGTIFFLIPFCIIVINSSKNFVISSFLIGETSPDPGGLPARYLLKSILPLSFVFLLLQGLALFFRSFLIIINKPVDGE